MKTLSLTLIVFLLVPDWISRLTVCKNELYGFIAKISENWNPFANLKKQASKSIIEISTLRFQHISFLTLPHITENTPFNAVKSLIIKPNIL